ncbi:TetR/AcrR family transcriptional regulator [Leucobacter sp. HY1908]
MPKIVDHEERRRHIVEAVTRIIIRDGFDRVTMREIAAEAGYAHGAIVRYFPNKNSLLTASFLSLYDQANARIATELPGLRGLAGLERICLEILPFGEVGPLYARVVISFWDHASQNEGLVEIHRENNSRWRELFRMFLTQAREDGELAAHVDIEAAVNQVAAHNAGWQMTAVLLPENAGDENVQRALDTLIQGLRAPADTAQ